MSKEEILDAAAVIFSKKGYHASSMQDIADAVNLQKASLYHHVSRKQEILKALLDNALDRLIDEMEVVVSQPIPPDEKLYLGMQTYLGVMLQQQELASVLILEHRSLEPDLLIRHVRRRDDFEQLWRILIQDGVDSGVFTCKDTALTTRALLGVLNWTITWYDEDDKYSPFEIANIYGEFILNGLVNRNKSTAN